MLFRLVNVIDRPAISFSSRYNNLTSISIATDASTDEADVVMPAVTWCLLWLVAQQRAADVYVSVSPCRLQTID